MSNDRRQYYICNYDKEDTPVDIGELCIGNIAYYEDVNDDGSLLKRSKKFEVKSGAYEYEEGNRAIDAEFLDSN